MRPPGRGKARQPMRHHSHGSGPEEPVIGRHQQQRRWPTTTPIATQYTTTAQRLLDGVALLAHDLSCRAALTGRARDARAAIDAAQAAHLLWYIAETYAEEVMVA